MTIDEVIKQNVQDAVIPLASSIDGLCRTVELLTQSNDVEIDSKEAARLLNCTPQTIRKYADLKQLLPIVCGQYRFKLAEIVKFRISKTIR
ncbi:hypothetical protein OAO18_05720 [Francisellaceae bacterium]|nr:hypothetical protein [Francisellaceae bacterium]